MLRNVRFTQWGNNTNNTYYRGVMIAGYNSEYRDNESSNGRYQFQSRIQGIVIDNCNTPNQNYTGLSIRHPYGLVVRNNCVYYSGNHLYWQWSSQHNVKWYNNYATRTDYSCHYNDANYEPYTDTAYNYYTRSDDYGMLMHQNREGTVYRHIILLNHEQRAFYMYYTANNTSLYRFFMDGYRTFPHHGESNGPVNWIDCYFGNKWFKDLKTGQTGIADSSRYLCYGGPGGRSYFERNTGANNYGAIYEFNFENDVKAEYFGGGMRIYDPDERAWKVLQLNASLYPSFTSSTFVPANTVVRLSAFYKGENNSNYSFPYLYALPYLDRYNAGRFITDYTEQTTKLTSSDTRVQNSTRVGFLERVQFTSACRGAYEEKQLTISARNSSYMLVYGIHASSNNSEEIGYMRDINVYFDKVPKIIQDDMPGKRVNVRNSFTQIKKRISGRI